MRPIFHRGALVLATGAALSGAAAPRPHFRVDVDVVQVTVTVREGTVRYLKGLEPGDFQILEDGVPQSIRAFAPAGAPASPFSGNVFVLFDTSNCMYEGFAHAEDAIAGFIRGLDPSTKVAVPTFSRNMFRAVGLTSDRPEGIAGLRQSVAGEDTALYNALLLTIRDASGVTGRKAIVVFSNGPDNASIVAPDDVLRLAEDEGVSIYVVSTAEANRTSRDVFARLTRETGGRLCHAKRWSQQAKAFEAIRDELGSAYTLAYYPEPNASQGFRKIEVRAVRGENQYEVQARADYRPARPPGEPWPPIRVAVSQ